MKKLLSLAVAILCLSTLTVIQPAFAAGPKCPQCKMTLAAKKSTSMPTPIKMSGKTYYCCGGCKPASYGKSKTLSTSYCAKCGTNKISAKKDKKHPYAVKVNGKTMYACCKPKKS